MFLKSHHHPHSSAPRRTRVSRVGMLAVAGLVTTGLLVSAALAAQSPVGLGTAGSFGVLAGSAVTNTGSSTINGDLGVSPGTAVSGFPPGTVNGSTHSADAVAAQAESDLTTAYNDAASRKPSVSIPGELGGLTLTPGVYKASSSTGLTGTLTLDGQGNSDAVFIFQVGSTLTTASGSHVALINGARACNVVWQIGSSATLGTSSVMSGNILALTSISVDTGATIQGSALARNGAVTLDDDTISAAHCATTGTGTGGSGSGGSGSGGSGSGGSGSGPTGSGTHNGSAVLTTVPRSVLRTGFKGCEPRTFHALVTGLFIRNVVFSLGSRTIATRTKSPYEATVKAAGGLHTVTARVSFTDGTPAATLHLKIRACAAATRHVTTKHPPSPTRPPVTTGGFTG